MNLPVAHAIETSTHGRYLIREGSPSSTIPAPTLVGFHGYAEPAETQMDRLMAIPGADRWQLISIQALHRFYRGRSQDVVASWMTRQDRELALADNAAYVSAVLARVSPSSSTPAQPIVFAGFSQGVATAFRAACHCRQTEGAQPPARAVSVIAVGGDVPPELDRAALALVSGVLLGRGARDEWYTADKWRSDIARLEAAAPGRIETLELDAAHEWSAEFSAAAGVFISRALPAPRRRS